MIKISICTATFNREKKLKELYQSLISQNCYNFEWIIIDDGSTDNTNLLVKKWLKNAPFEIIYFCQKNGGKHRAINKGIELAKCDLFFIVDSDDILPNNCVSTIIKLNSSIKNNKNLMGFVGLRAFKNKNALGTTFDGKYIDIYHYERNKNNISGDKAEVFFTRLLKKYRFIEVENEKFISEAILWNQIALDGYKMRYFNETIYLCDYYEDGLTKNLFKNYKNSPIGFKLFIKQSIKIETSLLEKIKYVSIYYDVLKSNINYKKVSRDLDVCLLFVVCSCFIRKVYNFMKVVKK